MPSEIAGIRIPDTQIIVEATDLVREVSSLMLFNHVMRCYFLGELLARKRRIQYDREVVYLGTVLHDLGLTERFAGPHRFEVEGANVARTFATERGFPEDKSWLVWDGIALHASLGLSDHKQAEVRAIQLGIMADVRGAGLEELAKDAVDAVLQAYPRLDFKKRFFAVLLREAEQKRQTAFGSSIAEVAHHHVPGFVTPDPRDTIEAAPFPE